MQETVSYFTISLGGLSVKFDAVHGEHEAGVKIIRDSSGSIDAVRARDAAKTLNAMADLLEKAK